MVQKLLNDEQKALLMQGCKDILKHLDFIPDLLKRAITDDETWIFKYDPVSIGKVLNQTSESVLEKFSITTDQKNTAVKVQK